MYCIISVVYGIGITEEKATLLEEEGIIDNENIVTSYYSGAGDESPRVIGEELCEFDEATETYMPVSDIRLIPTEEEKAKAKEKWDMLPEELKKQIPWEPIVMFAFHTS